VRIIIIISGSRRRDRNFVDEFHARRRGIRGNLGKMILWESGLESKRRKGTNRWRRRIWEYPRY